MKKLNKMIVYGVVATTVIYAGNPLLVHAVGETKETTSDSSLLESSEVQQVPSLSTEQSKEAVTTNTINSTAEQAETNKEEVYSEESTPLNVVEMVPINRTQMKVTISNPNGGNVTRVQFPTWSSTNGQDDLKWLQGTRNADGSYSVVVNADEYKHEGLFITDIYGTVDGKMQKLSETNHYYLEKSPVNIITITPISKTQIKLIISNPNGGNVTRVQFPTWSSTNGQDDLKWLQGTRNADGSYSVVVNADEYKHEGLFITDIYGTVDGKMQKLGETTTYSLEKSPANIITTVPIGKTQMKLTISNPNWGNVTRVQFPTWTHAYEQEDIQWLQGIRNADGSYSVIVNADEYGNNGLFTTDIYGTVDGKMQKLGQTTTYNLEKSPANSITTTPIGKTQMKLTISNPNRGNVSKVQFPTWSSINGQDDLQWLQGTRNADGSYSVVVNADEFKHEGLFITDIYGTVDGKMQKLGQTTTYNLEKSPANLVTTTPIGKTQMKVTISNLNGGDVTRVQFPTWSNTNEQDDLQWLQGTRNADGSYSVEVDSANFKHGGLFITDIYGTVNGQLQKLGGTRYNLEQQDDVAIRLSKKPYYYSQLDGKWSGLRYGMSTLGPSGCVPTSMAMVLKGHFGMNVTPVDAANRIYSYGGFNQQYFGASGPDLIKGMNSYGKQAIVMNSLAEFNDYLSKGYPVITYLDVGIGHAVVCHGYMNGGYTTVYDPYNKMFYDGRVATGALWSSPSQDYVDWTAGRPFFAIK